VPDPARRALLARRLFSLSGVVPLGLFLVLHVAINSRALRGDAAFARAIAVWHGIPALPIVESLFVFAPLILHGVVGLWLVATRRALVPSAPYPRGVRLAMRITGVVAVAFVALHLPELRFRQLGARVDGGALATLLASDLSSTWHGVPLRGVAYLVGTGCVVFHFAAGLWGFVATTERGRAERARRWTAWGAAVLGAAMWALVANVVVYYATGARLFGSP
jgi:succinate dehydrogenase/fumarate reductase cytochrome b subunit (b558 family)